MIMEVLKIGVPVLVTWYLAMYFHRRSRDRTLSLYVKLFAAALSGLSKDDRAQFRLNFKGVDVEDLHQLEFVVANTGELAIQHTLQPLRLHLPNGARLLDVSIIKKSPDELSVKARPLHPPDEGDQGVEFDFPLLNRGEYFVVKILIDGEVAWRDCFFSIESEDLQRRLKLQLPPSSQPPFGGIVWIIALMGLIGSLMGLGFCGVAYALWIQHPTVLPLIEGVGPRVSTLILGFAAVCGTITFLVSVAICTGVALGRRQGVPLSAFADDADSAVSIFDPSFIERFVLRVRRL